MVKKPSFSKVENAIEKALQKLFIDNLSELAGIANIIYDPKANLSNKSVEDIISRFQKELKKLKTQDPKLFERLNLTKEKEERFLTPSKDFLREDWVDLRELKIRIDELKRELYGEETVNAEYDKQVAKERRKHVNKRFNVRDGWLPLK